MVPLVMGDACLEYGTVPASTSSALFNAILCEEDTQSCDTTTTSAGSTSGEAVLEIEAILRKSDARDEVFAAPFGDSFHKISGTALHLALRMAPITPRFVAYISRMIELGGTELLCVTRANKETPLLSAIARSWPVELLVQLIDTGGCELIGLLFRLG